MHSLPDMSEDGEDIYFGTEPSDWTVPLPELPD